jgi:hypothetical protein
MAQKIHDPCEPVCPTCETAMVLVRIVPRVVSFSELRTYRCFACDDVRGTGHQRTLLARVSTIPRPALTRAA